MAGTMTGDSIMKSAIRNRAAKNLQTALARIRVGKITTVSRLQAISIALQIYRADADLLEDLGIKLDDDVSRAELLELFVSLEAEREWQYYLDEFDDQRDPQEKKVAEDKRNIRRQVLSYAAAMCPAELIYLLVSCDGREVRRALADRLLRVLTEAERGSA